MRNFSITFSVAVLLLSITSCSGDNILGTPNTISQGVEGKVLFWEGNHMPVSGTGSITPAERLIHVHTATRRSDVVWSDTPTLAEKISTKRVALVHSTEDGIFRVNLPAGTYSIFVEEEDGLYANFSNGDGILQPIVVKVDSVSKTTINITYKAVF